jgi:hypothetical protein
MLGSAVPLLLLRLCAAHGLSPARHGAIAARNGASAASLEHERIALLAARLLAKLAGLSDETRTKPRPPSAGGFVSTGFVSAGFVSAGFVSGGFVSAAHATDEPPASAAAVRHVLRQLLPGSLPGSLGSPARFLRRLRAEWREPDLIWTHSMGVELQVAGYLIAPD